MQLSAFVLAGIAGLVLSATANAAPAAPRAAMPEAAGIVRVAGGCGLGFHRTRRGFCVPSRYGYYRPYPVWPGYYGGDGHEPWNRPSPADHVANRLNRQELRGGWR